VTSEREASTSEVPMREAGRVGIGTLGAARITPSALVKPARQVPAAAVVAVAARDPERARKFAAKHGIRTVHDTYDLLLADPAVDAVYNPLPNGLHCEWTLKALDAGKHVLCEKPFTANAAEAERVAARADETRLVVMEAFHYRYHPLAQRMKDVVDSGVLGTVRHVETWMCIPLPLPRDIRYQYDLAGGATMDVGAYAIHMLRLLAGEEPTVASARARLASPKIDRWMTADFAFADGRSGRMTCALWSSTLLKTAVRVAGDDGELRVFNPTGPQFFHRLSIRTKGGVKKERLGRKPTYTYQLEAFTDAVLRGTPVLTPPSDAVANMRVIDEVYRHAGLPLRGEPQP
jgi:predicted dehydrogenase